MSITIGIYDFFSYAIPGSLYLLTGIYLFASLSDKLGKLSNLSLQIDHIVLFAVGGYLVGILFDFVARKMIQWLFKDGRIYQQALDKFSNRGEYYKVDFAKGDWPVLLAYIKHNSPENLKTIEKNKALSMMLRNTSFCGLLLFLGQVACLFVKGYSNWQLTIAFGAIVLVWLSGEQSLRFHRMFFQGIFETTYALDPVRYQLIAQGEKGSSVDNAKDN